MVASLPQSKAAGAMAVQVPEDQDRLLGEAKRQVDKNAFEMKSSLVRSPFFFYIHDEL